MLITETPNIEITFNSDKECLLINCKQRSSVDEFKEVFLNALEFVAEHGPVKFFCTDLSHIGPLQREFETWLMQEYYPQVYAIIRSDIHAAVVFSEDHFKAIVTNYQVQADQPQEHFIRFNYFTDLAEALHWLSRIKKGQDVLLTHPGLSSFNFSRS